MKRERASTLVNPTGAVRKISHHRPGVPSGPGSVTRRLTSTLASPIGATKKTSPHLSGAPCGPRSVKRTLPHLPGGLYGQGSVTRKTQISILVSPIGAARTTRLCLRRASFRPSGVLCGPRSASRHLRKHEVASEGVRHCVGLESNADHQLLVDYYVGKGSNRSGCQFEIAHLLQYIRVCHGIGEDDSGPDSTLRAKRPMIVSVQRLRACSCASGVGLCTDSLLLPPLPGGPVAYFRLLSMACSVMLTHRKEVCCHCQVHHRQCLRYRRTIPACRVTGRSGSFRCRFIPYMMYSCSNALHVGY